MNETADVEAQLKVMITKFGYEKVVEVINTEWNARNIPSWPSYQRLLNLARNVNNQINRSKPKEKK